MPAGRPRKYNTKQVKEIGDKLEQYIDETRIPILAEFAYQNKIPRDVLYKYEEYSTLIKRLIDKKEAQLERLTLERKINTTMAIFSLKQIGWRDIPKEADVSSEVLNRLIDTLDKHIGDDADG